ncbi:E3 ubiquitin-protein ligase TRIM45-like [Branchiostoma lanceolatum]|uniref:E3 ubiquitin-protein ligase TRIM45-like n=1 Tax=Branchiostoma lanceolatum TaxID=7740 RepID=UPI0034525111
MPKRKSSNLTKGSKSKEETKADAILGEISGDFLECPICLEPLKDPKILPCLHTFCEGCLKKFVAQDKVKNKFQCPTCRTETVLPKGGVASFKSNFFVQSLSDTVQAHKSLVSKEDDKVQCDNCEEEGANHGCVPCEEFFCDECICAHRRGKRTRSHEVIGAADLKEQLITKTGSLKSKSLPICPKHDDEKMKFYCETCKHPICRDCTVLQHKNHQYGYLGDTVCNIRAEIKNKLEAARQKITKYQDKASAVAKKQAELDTRRKKAAVDINAAAKEEIKYLTSLVRCKQTELKERLASITADRSKQLSSISDSVGSTLDGLSSTVDFSEKVIEHGSDFDVMNAYSDVTARLQSLLEGSTPDIPDDISYVMFELKTGKKNKFVVLGNNNDEEIQDDEMADEENSRAEATFRFTVDNFSNVNERKLSPAVFIRNLPWEILIQPEHKPDNKSLGVYLQCDADFDSLLSCRASAELRLIPQKNDVQTYKRNISIVFYSNEKNWGYRDFMPWHEVCDPQKGYIKDDKIILEAYVKADAPRGMKEIILGNILSEEMQAKKMELQTEETFRFTVENVSKLMGKKLSRTVFICNLPWKIVADPDSDAQWPNNKNLSVYLQCDADSNSFWSCCTSVELRLLPQMKGVQAHKQKFDHVFHSNENKRGFPEFMLWDEVCDPQKGYIKEDKIILEASLKAGAACAMV